MSKLSIKRGDTVKVIAGNSRGKTGVIRQIVVDTDRAVVEGLNMVKKHLKPSATNPNGSIVEKEAPIHVSNLMVIDKSNGQATRVGRRKDKNGNTERFSVKTKNSL